MISKTEINQLTSLLNSNKPLTLDKEKNWKVMGFKQRLAKVFVPGYSKRRDIECAEALYKKLQSVLQSIPPSNSEAAPSEKVTPQDVAKLAKATEKYIKKTLKRHWFKPKALKKVITQLNQELNIHKVGSKLDLPFEELRKNAKFVKFALNNHLHNKITKGHQETGYGVNFKNGTFNLHLRGKDNKPIATAWDKVPQKKNGKIDGLELFEHGWQKYDPATNVKLDALKIVDADSDKVTYSAKKPRMEIITVRPSYNLQKLGLGTFGHSYIHLHEPVLDSKGSPTGKVKIYSIGFNLETIVFRDPFEDIQRSACSNVHDLTWDQLKEAKKLIVALRELELNKSKNKKYKSDDPRLERIYHRAVNRTCTNFATSVYKETTGVNFNGRPIITRILFPSFLDPIFDKIWKIFPSCMTGFKEKVQFLTRGEFPQVMVYKQQNSPKRTNVMRAA